MQRTPPRSRPHGSPGRLGEQRQTTLCSDLAMYWKATKEGSAKATRSRDTTPTQTRVDPAEFRTSEGLPQPGAAGHVYHKLISMPAAKQFVSRLGDRGEVPLPGVTNRPPPRPDPLTPPRSRDTTPTSRSRI